MTSPRTRGPRDGLPDALATSIAQDLARYGDAMPAPGATLTPQSIAWLPTEAAQTPSVASTPARRLPRIALASEGAADPEADLELRGVLGQGGMGRVDLAVQRGFDRPVAVKRVREDRRTAPAVAALVHEALITGSLDHPGIVPAFAFGQSAEGEPVLVMKRIEGVAWSALLRDPTHPGWASRGTDQRAFHLGVLRHLCNAVESAHRRGIVHRDLKPDNVMLGELGEVQLLDWGIALRLDEQRSSDLAGTPMYMAPEMLRGGLDVGPRTDVYLLGAVLHEVLTGRPPHAGDELWQVLASVHEPAPLAFDASVPRDLAALCERALATDPKDRFASALALREALDDHERHRGSLDLSAAAAQRLGELEAALAEGASSEAAHARLRLIAAEVDLAFRLALVGWPGNPDALDGRERAVAMMIDFEVSARNAPGARALLSQLRAPSPELLARVEALEALRADEVVARERLQRLAHEGNLDVAARQRVLAFLVLWCSFGALWLVLGWLGLALTHPRLLGAFTFASVSYAALLVVRRSTLLVTESNRRFQASAFLAIVSGIPATALGWSLGAPVDATHASWWLLLAVGNIVLGIWAERSALLLALLSLPPITVSALWPGHGFYALASCVLVVPWVAYGRSRWRPTP